MIQEAIQISLGGGRVGITVFTDEDGHGLTFQQAGEPHEIGEAIPPKAELHTPQPGEVYIHCANRESALVLLEMAACVVAKFNP